VRDPRSRRWTAAVWPFLLGAGWVLCLLGSLLSPTRALANRDIDVFHLPLRSSFRDLAQVGLPAWNPWLHGGQPVLSNPSYGAFYPPSWLVFVAPPHYALSLMAMLHASLAFAGAWLLARRFGCDRGAAALAGIGYSGCGAYLSLLSAYNLFGSMAWLPWVLAWGDATLRMPSGARWWRPALLAGGALGLQLVSGEPSPAVMSCLALLALAAAAAGRRLAAVARVAVTVLFASALAAVQLLPTSIRLAESPRGALSPRVATIWSMPPERLVELVFPRFFGDPTLDVEGYFFGWSLNDRGYPYIESLYPGLVLTILAAAALLRGRIPRRGAWALLLAAGCALALGRHNPVFAWLREWVPGLAVFRYPEKFILLAVFALGVAGALGWQRLLDERDAGRPSAAELPFALALVALATALTLTALLFWAPQAAFRFIAAQGDPLLPLDRDLSLAYLRRQGWAAAGTAAAVALLLGLLRWRRPSRGLLETLAVLLLAADLWHYGHRLVQTLPVAAYRTPPPLAAGVDPGRERIYVQPVPQGATQAIVRHGDPRTLFARRHLAALEPYSGLLWRLPYAFNVDYELMLTGWGQKADRLLAAEGTRRQSALRYLGVWNVGTLFLQKGWREKLAELGDPAAPPLRKVANEYVLPRFRFAPRVVFHPSYEEAVAEARAEGWQAGGAEHFVRPDRRQETASSGLAARLLAVRDEAARIAVRYRAEESAYFVAAITYDRGWTALVDGVPVETYPTAACQLGVPVPGGEHQLVLRYQEPRLGLGAALSLLALSLEGMLFGSGRRRTLESGFS
jgi:hypothetical protein